MIRAAALLTLLCATAFAQDGDGANKKPFRPPRLQPTTGIKVLEPAESKTSAGVTLESSGGNAGAKDKAAGVGPGGMMGRLTPYVWSGEAPMEKGEAAPQSQEAEAVRVGIRACKKGSGPVPDAKACCPLGAWYNYENGRCWSSRGDCMDGRKSSRCVHVEQAVLKTIKGKVKADCGRGESTWGGGCCPSKNWSFRGSATCFADEDSCSSKSGNQTCFTLDELSR